LRLGFQEYPKWVHQPDGRHRIVSTREEDSALFTADWITKGIVTGPVDTSDVKMEGAAAKFDVEPLTVVSRTAPGEGAGYVELLRQILPKKNDMTIEGWADLRGFARTTVYTWKKSRLAGSALKGRLGNPGGCRRTRTPHSDPLGLARTRPSKRSQAILAT
jgi:hypothetical protein